MKIIVKYIFNLFTLKFTFLKKSIFNIIKLEFKINSPLEEVPKAVNGLIKTFYIRAYYIRAYILSSLFNKLFVFRCIF